MTTPRLGAPELSTSQASKEATINETFYWLDAASMGGLKVIDRDLDTPPVSPSQGDCYIMPASPTGAWSTASEDDVALFIGTAWEIRTPQEGWEAWVVDEAVKLAFSSSAWGIIGTFDGAAYVPLTYLDTDDTLAADSDVKVPTQQAVKAYVDGQVAGAGATETTAAEYRAGTTTGEYVSPDVAWDAADYVALADSGGNIAVDLSSGLNFTMTMDGDYTLSAPSNGKPGQTGVIVLTQDGTGTQTLAYNAAWKFAGGTDPTLSTAAGAVDLLFYQVLPNGTDVYANLVKAVA